MSAPYADEDKKYYDLWTDYVEYVPPPSRVLRQWYAQIKARREDVLSIGQMKRLFVNYRPLSAIQRAPTKTTIHQSAPHQDPWKPTLEPGLLAFLLSFPAPKTKKNQSRSRSRGHNNLQRQSIPFDQKKRAAVAKRRSRSRSNQTKRKSKMTSKIK